MLLAFAVAFVFCKLAATIIPGAVPVSLIARWRHFCCSVSPSTP
jgi:hypothetical protein